MKIDNNLVLALNTGLQDLFYEVGVLSRLEDFESQEELQEFLERKFSRELDENGLEMISDDEKMRDGLAQALKEIGVTGKDSLKGLMEQRYNVFISNSTSASEFAASVRNDVAALIQVDKVTESLVKFGLSSKALKEIDKIKSKEITKLCDILLVKLVKLDKEVANG